VNYAFRIQQAIQPPSEVVDSLLAHNFVLYLPKDVVSGDFPWVFEKGDYIYYGAVDCTGHGVPGAMMSLIGCLLLNDVVNSADRAKTPSELLNELHLAVVKTLKQDAPGNKAADGMDLALCRFNKKKKELIYAGAHRPLYHISNGELIEYKGCKFPVGGMQYKGANNFVDHHVPYQSGDAVYFFSDGYPDQFGGPEKLKFGPKRIRNLILDNVDKSMDEMGRIFEGQFNEWMGDGKQIDDVLVIGVEL